MQFVKRWLPGFEVAMFEGHWLHVSDELAACTLEYLPIKQSVQWALPAVLLYEPTLQARHIGGCAVDAGG